MGCCGKDSATIGMIRWPGFNLVRCEIDMSQLGLMVEVGRMRRSGRTAPWHHDALHHDGTR
jgi:hypothetical protein